MKRNHNKPRYIYESIAAISAGLLLGAIAYNQYIESTVDTAEPVPITSLEGSVGRTAIEQFLAQERADTSLAKQAERAAEKAEFEQLTIEPSEVVNLTIEDAKISDEKVKNYDIKANLSEDGDTLVYDPPFEDVDSMFVTSDVLGVDIDDDGKVDDTYGPLGLENGELKYMFQTYGHTYTRGEGAADYLGKMRQGSLVKAVTRSGVTYFFTASSDPVFPDKTDPKSMFTMAGEAGGAFTCFSDTVDGKQVISNEEYTFVPLELAAVQLKGGKLYNVQDFDE